MYNLDIGVIIPLEELLEHGTKKLRGVRIKRLSS